MTPDERDLINGLFDRMRGYDLPQKDRDAEALINQAVRATPDAPYMLVQSVLVQEQALEAANARVQELEARVRELEGAQTQQGSGSFLGGLFGGGQRAEPERRPSSVPTIGSRASGMPSMFPSRAQAAPEPPQQPATGGFMRSAMATAAGVAGGMLLAEGIRNMMGSNSSAQAQHATPTDSGDKKTEQAEADTDRNVHEADYDSSHNDTIDWGGDLDI